MSMLHISLHFTMLSWIQLSRPSGKLSSSFRSALEGQVKISRIEFGELCDILEVQGQYLLGMYFLIFIQYG